jgi:hypothetical protein
MTPFRQAFASGLLLVPPADPAKPDKVRISSIRHDKVRVARTDAPLPSFPYRLLLLSLAGQGGRHIRSGRQAVPRPSHVYGLLGQPI